MSYQYFQLSCVYIYIYILCFQFHLTTNTTQSPLSPQVDPSDFPAVLDTFALSLQETTGSSLTGICMGKSGALYQTGQSVVAREQLLCEGYILLFS